MPNDKQKLVQVNGLGVVAFPDTMSDDDISAAIQKHLNSQPQASMQAASEPSTFQRMKSVVANSAIGHALESTTPKFADALGLHPTATFGSPDYERQKGQLVSPEEMVKGATSKSLAGKMLDALAAGAGNSAMAPNLNPPKGHVLRETTQQKQTPVGNFVTGATEGVGGLTTPENLLLMAAPIGEVAGIFGKAAKQIAPRLLSAGFSAQMIKGLYDQAQAYKQAKAAGDDSAAEQILGQMTSTAPFLFGAAGHALGFLGHAQVPTRANTRVVHANPVGEVRMGADNIPTIWMHPAAFNEYMKVAHPDEKSPHMIAGENVPINDLFNYHATGEGISKHPVWEHVQDLLQQAQAASPEGTAVLQPRGGKLSNAVRVLREEKIHSWQRSLSQDRNFNDYLEPATFSSLAAQVPDATRKALGLYQGATDPIMVNEVAARYIANDLHGATPEEASAWLSQYFKSVVDKHGVDALSRLERTRGLASSLKEAIENEHRGANTGAAEGSVPNVSERGPAGAPQTVAPAGPAQPTPAPAYGRTGAQPAAEVTSAGEIMPPRPEVDKQAKADFLKEFENQRQETEAQLRATSDPRERQRLTTVLQRLSWMRNNLEVHNTLSAEPLSGNREIANKQLPSVAGPLFSRLREEVAGRDPDNFVRRGAEEFVDSLGRTITSEKYLPTDFRSKEIADAYDQLQHNPNDPAVAAAYEAMKRDVVSQWKHATRNMGITFEPSKENPYMNSADMRADLMNNRRLRFYQGGDMPADHPLAQINPETGYTYNDMLRAVHDLFGHAMEGYQFGPRGEENAWNAHAQMFSPEALPALTTETKGQNSWVNAGPQMRDAQGNILQPGQPGYLPPQERAYAEQKAGILPERFQYRTDSPISFVSPNTLRLSLPEAQERLSSRIQSRFAGAARDLARALGLQPSVRPVLGSWQGGAENSTIHQFPVGTDPDLVRYYSAILGKLGYQNSTGAFFPAEGGPDNLYAFWTENRSPSDISKVLLDNGVENSTIEPAGDGHVVYLIGSGDQFHGSVDRVTDALGVKGHVEQYAGTAEFPGNYDSREAAARDFTAAAEALESKHPEWRQIREGYESRPDIDSLRRLIESVKEVAPEPQLDVVHYSNAPDIQSLDPSYYGQNRLHDVSGSVVNRPDLRRKENFPDYWNPETYVGEDTSPEFRNAAGERFAARQYTYKGKVPALGIYDLASDPDKILDLSRKELAERNFKKFGVRMQPSDAEVQAYAIKRLKDLGYSGRRDINGMIASWEKIPVQNVAIPPSEDIRSNLAKSTADAAFSRTWDEISKILLPDQLARYDTPEKQQKIVDAVNAMPTHEEWDAYVKAGMSGSLWYERSSRAFDALMRSMPDVFAPKDKTKFLNFVSALSPVQPVRQNLLMAINLWDKWNSAGRPMDVEWKNEKKFSGVKNKNASLYRILQGRGNTYGVDLPARLQNAIRALQGQPLSGPKVSAFAPNLGEDVDKSTNDTWMAVLANVDPNQINQPHLYDGVTVAVRKAAKENGIPTRQGQAAAWSFIKSLAELSGWGKEAWRPPAEVLKQGYLTPDLINRHAADFADLLQNDEEIRQRIEDIGGDLDVLDQKLRRFVPERPTVNQVTTPEILTQLLGAARRLEAARNEGKTAAHLEAKRDQASLFDTSFNPQDAAFSRQAPSEDLYDLRDEYQNKLTDFARRGLNESGNLKLNEDEKADLSKTFRAMVSKFNQEYPNAGGQDLVDFVQRLRDFATPSAFSRVPKEQLDGYMDDLWKNSQGNPFDHRERIIGGAGVEMRPFDGKIHLSFIRSLDPGKGHASAALKAITDLADKHGVAIDLEPSRPKGMTGLNNKQLRDWYSRYGFVRGDHGTMVREPQGGPQGPEGGKESPAFSRVQTQTPEFKQWFGDSKVRDENDEPRVVYHGSHADIDAFKKTRGAHFGFHFGDQEAANTRLEDTADKRVDTGDRQRQQKNAEQKFEAWSKYAEELRSRNQPVPHEELLEALKQDDLGNVGAVNAIFDKYAYKPTPEEAAKLQQLRDEYDNSKPPIHPLGVGSNIGAYYLSAQHLLRMPDVGNWKSVKQIKEALPFDSDARTLPELEQDIKGHGYDGIVYSNRVENPVMRTNSYIVFDPEQIKSATGNRGTFDASNPNTAFSRAPVQNMDERNKAFEDIADQQRYHHEGDAEDAMLAVQHHPIGAGVWSDALEHVGDLLHRMTERTGLQVQNYGESPFGYGNVKDKVERKLFALKRDPSYIPFTQEAEQNLQGNFDYRKKRGEIPADATIDDLKNELFGLGEKYSQEHEKLPVYNRMQWLARQAAVDLGRRNFPQAQQSLEELKQNLDQGPEHWQQVAGQYDPSYEKNLNGEAGDDYVTGLRNHIRQRANEARYGEGLQKAEEAGLPVVRDYKELPPVPEGMVRIYHGARASDFKSIGEKGLLSGKELDSGERTPFVLATTTPQILDTEKYSKFYGRPGIVIADVPRNSLVNEKYGEVHLPEVKRQNIVGVYIPEFKAGDSIGMEELSKYSKEYNEQHPRESAFSRKPEKEADLRDLRALDPKSVIGARDSAALVTGDNKVLVGKFHDALAKQIGYETSKGHEWMQPFLQDGGVRIRSHEGTVYVNFGKDDPQTIERVRQSLKTLRGNDFVLNFSKEEGKVKTWDGTKQEVLQHLDDLETGRGVAPAPYGTARYALQNFAEPAYSRKSSAGEDFDKLRYIDPKSSLGLKNSAALVGPDNRVAIGSFHENLAEELGYKNNEFYKDDLFDDGGVRVRAQKGRMLVEFGDDKPSTFERVRNTINSLRGHIFIVDYAKGEKPHWKGTKEEVLQRLQDFENGREETQARYGTSQYFRQNLPEPAFSRQSPWYLKSQKVIDEKMKGPMASGDVLRMLVNAGIKHDELKWTGLDDLLKDNKKVTPEEIKQHLAENGIQIQEIKKGGSSWKVSQGEAEPTKYQQYVEPGGENYHELLLTLPDKRAELHLGPEEEDELADLKTKASHGRITPEQLQRINDLENRRDEARAATPFETRHWDEPNVLAHIRFNDRTTPDGKKLLHVEELQSDWHQIGRKQGYKGNPNTAGWTAKEGDGDPASGPIWEVRDATGHWILGVPRETARTPEAAILRAANSERGPDRKKAPDAPFKKDWHEMALRRIIQYAAENGYDGVSWTGGEKQAARYDLSKSVNEIDVTPREDGSRRVLIDLPDNQAIILNVGPDGIVNPKGSTAEEEFHGKHIDDVVGKEVGEKVLKADREIALKGDDLKVGGKGMIGFYDKIVPDYLNKFGKKFGAKVGEVELPGNKFSVQKSTEPGYQNSWDVVDESGKFHSRWKAKGQAESAAKNITAKYGNAVQYLPITPEMRSAATEQGQSLFHRGEGMAEQPSSATARPSGVGALASLAAIRAEAERRRRQLQPQ